MIENSVADKISKLCSNLIKQDKSDIAIEVATKLSQLNELVDVKFPIKPTHSDALRKGDEQIIRVRENYREALYLQHLKHYESLVSEIN